jgi:hypothetical protein
LHCGGSVKFEHSSSKFEHDRAHSSDGGSRRSE